MDLVTGDYLLPEIYWLPAYSLSGGDCWPRITEDFQHFFTVRRLAKNKRKNSRPFFFTGSRFAKKKRKNSSTIFHGKAVSQEEQGDFQPFLFTGRQLAKKNRETSSPFFSRGESWPRRTQRLPALSFYRKAVVQQACTKILSLQPREVLESIIFRRIGYQEQINFQP